MGLYEVRDTLASEAYISGRHAGKHGLSPSLNQHPVGSIEYIEWKRGWQKVTDERGSQLNREAARAKPCNYYPQMTCYCGGKGMCLDAA